MNTKKFCCFDEIFTIAALLILTALPASGELLLDGVDQTGGGDIATHSADTAAHSTLYQQCKTITNPNDADALLFGANQLGAAWAINEIRATALGGTSVVFTLQECDANGANCAAIMSALTVTTGTVGTATITDSSIADNAFLKIDIGTVTGAVTQLIVCVE